MLKTKPTTNLEDCEYLNIEDLAHYLRISRSAAQKLSASRVIPCFKPTYKIVLFRRSDVDDFVRRHLVQDAPKVDIDNLLMGKERLN